MTISPAVMSGADAVVHLAWQFHPTRRPVETWRANVIGTERVLDAAVAAGIGAVVVASSIGTYSPGGDYRVDEDWPTDAIPTAAYGTQKSYVERMLDAFELRHPAIRVVRIRPAFVFKRESSPEQRRIFAGPLLPGWLLAHGRLPLIPLPTGLRLQVVHSDDVAAAFAAAVELQVTGAFNIAAEPVLHAADVGELLGARPVELAPRLVRAALAAAFHLRLAPAEPGLVRPVLLLAGDGHLACPSRTWLGAPVHRHRNARRLPHRDHRTDRRTDTSASPPRRRARTSQGSRSAASARASSRRANLLQRVSRRGRKRSHLTALARCTSAPANRFLCRPASITGVRSRRNQVQAGRVELGVPQGSDSDGGVDRLLAVATRARSAVASPAAAGRRSRTRSVQTGDAEPRRGSAKATPWSRFRRSVAPTRPAG